MNKKKTKIPNKFDQLVQQLVDEFVKIPNFDLTQKDENANKIFNSLVFRLADISSFKELVLNHYIPATNKAIFDSEQQMRNSKYSFLLNVDKEDLKETLYQTIRLAYVGMFHKVESFANDIIIMSSLLTDDKTTENIEKYAKRKFNFSLKDWSQFFVTHKINWVCNCVKHYDSFPLKNPRPLLCETFENDKRIKLTVEDFKFDTELLIKFLPVYLQIMFSIQIHKSQIENYDREFWKDSPEILKIHDEAEIQMEELIRTMLTKMKELAG
jgi:hypothetical protein